MAKMINLTEEPNVNKFMSELEDNDLIIYEDIQGSKLYVNFTGDRFIIKPKSHKNDELKFVDLAVQKFYNKAYAYFHTLPKYITDMLNKNWWFCFEYLPSEKTANIQYSKLPKNNLILTSIVKGNKHNFNYDELMEYSNLFGVDMIPIVFKGKLSGKQMEILRLYLKTSDEDLKFIFGEETFSEFFYKVLNPNIENSFLMLDDEYNDNLEKLIIRINGDDRYTFEILNPLYERTKDKNRTEHSQVFSLIIVNFLEFLQLKNISNYKLKSLTKDEMYVNFISTVFNEYIENIKNDIESWDILVPEFIKDDKFKINTNLIRNKKTCELIKSSIKIEYLFKIILGSFNKKRKKPIGVMKQSTIDIFNKTVDKINKHLEYLLDINRDYRFQKIDLLNFSDYFGIQYDKDLNGEIYPDIGVEFEEPETSDTKKKKGIINKKKMI